MNTCALTTGYPLGIIVRVLGVLPSELGFPHYGQFPSPAMMYGDPHPHQHQQLPPPPQQQPGGDFYRGQPPPPPMMRQPSASSTNINPDYHHPPSGPPHPHHLPHPHPHPHPPYDAHPDSYGAKRMRKLSQRRAVDYTSTVVRYMQIRTWQRDSRDRTVLQPTPAAAIDMLPAVAYSDNPSTSFAAKFVHTSVNKNRCSINRVLWIPTGRRLITGSQSGEFTLWNGQSFNFEMILQAHEQAIKSMVWSHNDNWMISGDDGGSIKYWQNNMNNVKVNKSAHRESVRDLSFCRTDLKFCSCSDDTTVKVWDFARCQEERLLTGRSWLECELCRLAPGKILISLRDNLVKLWDAKSGRELCSFHGHKNNVLCVKWNQNGNWILTSGKDQIIKLYDIRAMKELQSFRGHRKDVSTLAWHPFHEEYFVSGSHDGAIFHWLVGHETPQIEISNAHDNNVCDLAWHPIGYLLSSGSNDHTTKFWCRNRPGDTGRDKFNPGPTQGYGEQNSNLFSRMPGAFPAPDGSTNPGPFGSGLSRNEGTIPGIGIAMPLSIPSLDFSSQGDQKPGGAPPLPPGPHPSLLAPNQQPPYQQNPQQIQQHQQQPFPQIAPMSMPPQNMPQLQPPSNLPLLPHPHLSRPHQMPPHNMVSSMSMQSSGTQHTPQVPGAMGMQNSGNQMGPQGPYMGMNQMHSGSLPSGVPPPAIGGFPSGLNVQGPPSGGSRQMYPGSAPLNREQSGQVPMMSNFNPFQTGNQSGLPPPPPGPPPHGQAPL